MEEMEVAGSSYTLGPTRSGPRIFRVMLSSGCAFGPHSHRVTLEAEVHVPHFRALANELAATFGSALWRGMALDEDYHEADWTREVQQPDGRWLPIIRCHNCQGIGHCYDGLPICDNCHGNGYLIVEAPLS
jgi:hypothetical protein